MVTLRQPQDFIVFTRWSESSTIPRGSFPMKCFYPFFITHVVQKPGWTFWSLLESEREALFY